MSEKIDELKPCPFCGEKHLWTYSNKYAPIGFRYVKCAVDPEEDDGCVSGVSITTWQSRPIEDALRARIAELEQALEAARRAVHHRKFNDQLYLSNIEDNITAALGSETPLEINHNQDKRFDA